MKPSQLNRDCESRDLNKLLQIFKLFKNYCDPIQERLKLRDYFSVS